LNINRRELLNKVLALHENTVLLPLADDSSQQSGYSVLVKCMQQWRSQWNDYSGKALKNPFPVLQKFLVLNPCMAGGKTF
jgi:hypothetical protein